MPKSNTRMMADGSYAWAGMLRELVSDVQQWLREYHIRSSPEVVHSADKRRFPRHLLKRRPDRRHAEAGAKVCMRNVRRLGYIACMPNTGIKLCF